MKMSEIEKLEQEVEKSIVTQENVDPELNNIKKLQQFLHNLDSLLESCKVTLKEEDSRKPYQTSCRFYTKERARTYKDISHVNMFSEVLKQHKMSIFCNYKGWLKDIKNPVCLVHGKTKKGAVVGLQLTEIYNKLIELDEKNKTTRAEKFEFYLLKTFKASAEFHGDYSLDELFANLFNTLKVPESEKSKILDPNMINKVKGFMRKSGIDLDKIVDDLPIGDGMKQAINNLKEGFGN